MKICFRPDGVKKECIVTKKSNPDFVLLFQRAVLLAMKDFGYVDEIQYRNAEKLLYSQYTKEMKRSTSEIAFYD